jgi:hypothetical protein
MEPVSFTELYGFHEPAVPAGHAIEVEPPGHMLFAGHVWQSLT